MATEQEEAEALEDRLDVDEHSDLHSRLASVWQHTIAPHERDQGVLTADDDMEEGMTIVAGSTPAETPDPADALGSLSGTQRGSANTVMEGLPQGTPDQPETRTERGRAGTVPMGISTKGGMPQLVTDTNDDDGPTMVAGLKTTTSTDDSMLSTGIEGMTSLPMKTVTAGVRINTAKSLATTSKSRMVVRERSVIRPESDYNDELLRAIEPDYELTDLLGEGGMGMVYKARQTSVDREIALKMIREDIAEDEGVQGVFLAEAAVTGELEHPNIIPIYEMGIQNDGLLFYSMKQTKGTEWKRVIRKNTQEQNIEILMKVSDAIAFAHSKSIIHRDLKPENVMLGEFGEVLVMDWGMAVSVLKDSKIGGMTEATAAGGTPAYMAPEMVMGDMDRIGVHSDIYLLGAILFEIITGKRPHQTDKAKKKKRKMMQMLADIAQNKIIETDVKGELMDIAMKAMSTQPKDRYQTVQLFQDAVRGAMRHAESRSLTEKAQARLDSASEKKEYEEFAQALFGFQEAADMWEGNEVAREGAEQTRKAYARAALEKGDLDLAESMITSMRRAPRNLTEALEERRRSIRVRESRFKALKYSSAGLVATIIIGLSVAYVIVEGKRKEAETAKKMAEAANQVAIKERNQANKERTAAVEARKEEEVQRKKAQAAKADLEVQIEKTVAAKKQEEVQRKKAEAATIEAVKQHKQAVKAKEEEQRQRQQAVKAKVEAVAAKEDAVKQRQQAERQEKIAQEQRKVAEEALARLQRIGELRTRIKRSLTPEEAQAKQADAGKNAGLEVFRTVSVNKTPLELALVPSGEFVMGSDIAEKDRSGEEYLHTVKLTKPIYMGRKEFTQAQWLAVMGEPSKKDYNPATDANLPVVNVSHNQLVQEFLPRLQAFAPKGFTFRLPTEAEWEYACRAGNYGTFHGGSLDTLENIAWFQRNSGKKVKATGGKAPNAWGLYDMHGNASEICADYYSPNFYLSSSEADPLNTKTGDYRIARGGSCLNLPMHCRSAYRSFIFPDNQYMYMGFRVVLARN